jgi:molybdopterin-biosynthesis enzyme MoeA-like protein
LFETLTAEIIAIGSELLAPDRTDTNSLWLTEKLNALGIEVKLSSATTMPALKKQSKTLCAARKW